MFESGGGEVRLQCCDAAIAVPYDRTQSCRNEFSHLHFVHRLCAFCHLIGATGESPVRFMHKNGVRVKLAPPSVGGGADTPDYITTYMALHALYASSLIKGSC